MLSFEKGIRSCKHQASTRTALITFAAGETMGRSVEGEVKPCNCDVQREYGYVHAAPFERLVGREHTLSSHLLDLSPVRSASGLKWTT